MAPSGLYARLCHAFLVFFMFCNGLRLSTSNKENDDDDDDSRDILARMSTTISACRACRRGCH